jgi:hypothetical protein
MLLPREQSPWNCGYYLGAIALEALNKSPHGRLDLPDLQQQMGLAMKRAVSMTQVVSAAAWLYLIDAINLDESGLIIKCD